MNTGIGGVVYTVLGIFVAASNHYFSHVHALRPLISALLAIALWPLLLLGINLHIH